MLPIFAIMSRPLLKLRCSPFTKSRGSSKNWFAVFITHIQARRLGFEDSHTPVSQYLAMKKSLSRAGIELKMVPVKEMLESIRMIKDHHEIECIKKAIAISDDVIQNIDKLAKPGMTELELAWLIERHMRESGSEPVAFSVICASGPNSALPHAQPSSRSINTAEPVVLDFGARFKGYVSDLTRTICLGSPDNQFKKLYNIVRSAQEAAVEGIKTGMSAKKADMLARKIITKAGYREHFGHGLGHGIGLAVHEKPHLGASSKDVLQEGMVFTIEPGIYIPGWGGIRLEDNILLLNGRVEVLSKANKIEFV